MTEETDDLRPRLTAVINDRDLFRLIVRGFGIFEDRLEREINSMLEEPIDRLNVTPFKHKLSLAIALGLIPPEKRAAFSDLGKLRNQLAHAEREPEDVTSAEIEAIYDRFDPERDALSQLWHGATPTPTTWAAVTGARGIHLRLRRREGRSRGQRTGAGCASPRDPRRARCEPSRRSPCGPQCVRDWRAGEVHRMVTRFVRGFPSQGVVGSSSPSSEPHLPPPQERPRSVSIRPILLQRCSNAPGHPRASQERKP